MSEETTTATESKPEKKDKSKVIAGLDTGSTRMRLFKALKRYPAGLTPNQIKDKTGMLPKSGHLSVLLVEELESKRIRREEHMVATGRGNDEKKIIVYVLTAKGKKDLEAGKIDGNTWAGNRIGQLWTKPRKKAEKVRHGETATAE